MMIDRRPVFLCGMPGSGKSTVGRRLAEVRGTAFVDTDRLLMERFGASIPEIFAAHGEIAFRDAEQEVVESCCNKTDAVIALGGGALQRLASLERVLTAGLLVWIDTPLPEIVRRLQNDRERPLLRHADGRQRTPEELVEFLENLYRNRQSQYLKAHIRLVPEGDSARDAQRIHHQILSLP